MGQDEACKKCRLLLFEDPTLEAQPRHQVAVGVGRNCCWVVILWDPALVSVVYIGVKIPWVCQLSQYLEGQWDYPSQIRILLYLTELCIRRQVRYPLYGPWPHVPPHVLVVILWALLRCCVSRHVAGDLG